MTDNRPIEAVTAARQGRSRRSALLMAFLILLGIVMLLPGLCSLAVLISYPKELITDGQILLLWLVSLAIGIGGGVLIARARRLSGRTKQVHE